MGNIYYRGTNNLGKKIRTGNDFWDSNLFVSKYLDCAKLYGNIVEKIEVSDDSIIVNEHQLGIKQKKTENLLSYCCRVLKKAIKNNIDVLEFDKQCDIGTIIINKNKIVNTMKTITEEQLRQLIREAIEEKAKSKAQQHFFGMVDAYKKGEMSDASDSIKKAAKSMSKKDIKDFAETKHKGLPNHVKKNKKKVAESYEGDGDYYGNGSFSSYDEGNNEPEPIYGDITMLAASLKEKIIKKNVTHTFFNRWCHEQGFKFVEDNKYGNGYYMDKEGNCYRFHPYFSAPLMLENKPKDRNIGSHTFKGLRYDRNGNPLYTSDTLSDEDKKKQGWKYSKKHGLYGQISDPTTISESKLNGIVKKSIKKVLKEWVDVDDNGNWFDNIEGTEPNSFYNQFDDAMDKHLMREKLPKGWEKIERTDDEPIYTDPDGNKYLKDEYGKFVQLENQINESKLSKIIKESVKKVLSK